MNYNEQEFVSQYHFDARNFWMGKENGTPETKDVNFQLIERMKKENSTSMIVILTFMIVFDRFVISERLRWRIILKRRTKNEPRPAVPKVVTVGYES